MVEVFLDQQSLGLRKYLEAVGVEVRTDAEIRGNNDTSKSVPDEKVQEYVEKRPGIILVTKDRKFAKKARAAKLDLIFVDESQAVALEALRQLAKIKSPS